MMDSNKKINYESAQKVKDYLKNGNAGKLYTFTNFFIKNGYIKSESELEHRGGNVFTHCPFHYDKTPSFSFSEKRGICNCFSCGFGGTYIDLVLKYENDVNGRNLSYYGLLDDFLKNDSIMQATLGFSTVYTTYNIFKDGFEFKPFKPKRLKESYVPSHYLELANKIKRDGRPKEDIFEFILSMQANVPARTIYYQLYGIEDKGIASFKSNPSEITTRDEDGSFSTVTSPQDGSDSFSQSEILDGRGVSLDQGSTATVSAESGLSSDHVSVLAKQPQYTSKRLKNLYKKRNNSIQDYLHKLTKFITNYCVENEINTVIIGDLTGIKNRITNRDKKYNQKLHELPYEKIRILLEYKLACKGINFVLQNECYTSQCAPNTPSVERKYANKLNRVQRGLYVSEGNIYNADAVGAYNILRKYCDEHGIKKTFSIKGLTSVKVFKIKR